MLILRYLAPVIILSILVGIVLTKITLAPSEETIALNESNNIETNLQKNDKDIVIDETMTGKPIITTPSPTTSANTAIQRHKPVTSKETQIVRPSPSLARTTNSNKSSTLDESHIDPERITVINEIPEIETVINEVLTEIKLKPIITPTKKASELPKVIKKILTAAEVKPSPAKKEKQKIEKLTLSTFLATNWSANGSSATLLPSAATKCLRKSSRVECWSRPHQLKLKNQDQQAKTRSLIQDFSSTGFTVKYKHMFLFAEKSAPKWDDATYQSTCTISAGTKILCIDKNSNEKITFMKN